MKNIQNPVNNIEASPIPEKVLDESAKKQLAQTALETADQVEKHENIDLPFHVNVEDYPIFSRQELKKKDLNDPDGGKWNIDHTLAAYLSFTAKTIAQLDGSNGSKIDHVVYLDKSARPVSWLVDEFWDDLARKDENGNPVPRPEVSYLCIDRIPWFRRVGIGVDENMYYTNEEGKFGKASFSTFLMAIKHPANYPKDEIADIRALYNPNGRTPKETNREIFAAKTPLAGKNIMIIDEISDTGATPKVAQWIFEQAFPEVKSVKTHVFANFGEYRNKDGEPQMRSSCVWYPNDHSWDYGRGVLDPDENTQLEIYKNDPTPQNYARYKASSALGIPLDFDKEPYKESKELMREIHQMHEDFNANKILYLPSGDTLDEVADPIMEKQGTDYSNLTKFSKEIAKRPPENYISTEFPAH